jgi:hypothetical protein
VSQRISRIVLSGVLLACAVTLAFLLSMALIALTGGSAFGAASAMLQGGVESTASLMTSLSGPPRFYSSRSAPSSPAGQASSTWARRDSS